MMWATPRTGLWREANPLNEGRETAIGVQRVPERFLPEIGEAREALLIKGRPFIMRNVATGDSSD
jgi:hypothetical protein